MILGGYHYAQFFASPAAQAELYVSTLESVGFGGLDIIPIIDVEAGGERSANHRASASQVTRIVCGTSLAVP